MSSIKSSSLSPIILEAMARTLSDHDLLRFMLSSKEAFNATLDALSTVDYINYHDQNFEGEPCVSFRMRGDNKRKIVLNYITESNPLFNFVVTYVNSQITKLEIGELVAIESWVLNSLMTSRLGQLTLGIILPEAHQHLLKSFVNLTEIKYPNFDLFIANNFVPDSCKKIVIHYIDYSDILRISADFKKFEPTKVEELSINEEKLFLNDYDEDGNDLFLHNWLILAEFLLDAFPSLKTLNINVSGRSDYPFRYILNWFNKIKDWLLAKLSSHIEGKIVFNVLIPANEWLAIRSAFNRSMNNDDDSNDDSDDDISEEDIRFNKDLAKGFKNRSFPSYFNNVPYQYNWVNSKFYCNLHYYGKWDEYDFDAANNREYSLRGEPREVYILTARELSEADDMTDDITQSETNLVSPYRSIVSDSDITDNCEDILSSQDADLVFDDDYQLDCEFVNDEAQKIHAFYENENGYRIEVMGPEDNSEASDDVRTLSDENRYSRTLNFNKTSDSEQTETSDEEYSESDTGISNVSMVHLEEAFVLVTARESCWTIESQSFCTTTSTSDDTTTTESGETETSDSEDESTTAETSEIDDDESETDVTNCEVDLLNEATGVSNEFSNYSLDSTQSYRTSEDETTN